MSPAKGRARRARTASRVSSPPNVAQSEDYVPLPLPDWRWKTFPVYFAFAVGAFIGLYVGVIVQGVNNTTFTTVVFVVFAMLLGIGLSRLSTRFLLSRHWIKPRPRKKR